MSQESLGVKTNTTSLLHSNDRTWSKALQAAKSRGVVAGSDLDVLCGHGAPLARGHGVEGVSNLYDLLQSPNYPIDWMRRRRVS